MVERAGHGSAFANVLRRELRAAWRGALGWWLPAALMLGLTLSLQPEMAKKGSLFEEKMEMMPAALKVAFGLTAKNLADPVFFLAMNFTLIQLLGAVFAGMLGAAALAREEAFGTAELLYATPAARRTIALGKVAAALALVVLFDALLMVVAFASYASIGVSLADPGVVVRLFATTMALHAAAFAIGLAVTVRLARPRAAPSLALGVVFGLYGVGVVGALDPRLSGLRSLSPFDYAAPVPLVEGHGSGGLVLVAVVLAAISVALVLFERKDIHA